MKIFFSRLCIIILTAFICFNISPSSVYALQKYKPELNIKVQSNNLCDQALLNMLYPYILESVEKHYSKERQFDLFDAKIISINRPSEKYEFIIVVQIDTYTGAHNPPGGLVKITFHSSPYGTKVIKLE
jgi:hypothetical protein